MREGALPRSVDVVVVGAGVIGLAVAWALQRRGMPVLVLDRGEPGSGATGASAGMLAPVSEAETETPELLELGLDSHERYGAWAGELERASGIDVAYRADGSLWVALDRDDHERIEHLHETLRQRGLPARMLAREAVLDAEPHLSPRVLGALQVIDDHQVEPRALVRALDGAIRGGGGHIESGLEVREVTASGGRVGGVRAAAADGSAVEVEARVVVVAAGAWSGTSIELPCARPAVRPVKGQILRLRGAPLLTHLLRHPEVYLAPRADGDLLVGATMEEVGFDDSTTAGAAMDLLRRAFALVPGIYDLQIAEMCAGFRPASRQGKPIVGPTEVEGLFLATGHHRGGVLLAPATGELLAEAIVTGRTPQRLAPFAPARAAAVGGA